VSHFPYHGRSKRSKEKQTHNGADPDQQRRHGSSPLHLLLQIEPPMELVRLAQESLQNIAAQTVDLLDIGPVLLTEWGQHIQSCFLYAKRFVEVMRLDSVR